MGFADGEMTANSSVIALACSIGLEISTIDLGDLPALEIVLIRGI